MTSLKLSLDTIQNSFSDTIFQRGKNYQARGLVSNLSIRDTILSAIVEGSEDQAYKVSIQFENNQIDDATCSCPYGESFMGYCKHIAATLLQYHHEPEQVSEEESVASILEPLEGKELRGALEHLLTLYPEAIDRLELYLKKSKILQTSKSHRKQSKSKSTLDSATLDTRLYEKMMRSAVLNSGMDWDGFPEYDSISPIIDEISPFLEAGKYPEALILSKKLIHEFITTVDNSDLNLHDNIGFSDESIFVEFDTYLVEAIYGTTLTDDERLHLLQKVLYWNDTITNDWTSPDFNMSAYALAEGFETVNDEIQELIQVVHQYERYDSTIKASEKIRLKVMQQTGDLVAGLDYAKATGHGADYLIILYEQKKLEEVMEDYKAYLDNDTEALRVVEHLAKQHPTEALEIGFYRLTQKPTEHNPYADPNNPLDQLPYAPKRRELATACKNLAKALGNEGTQLDASITEFQYEPNLTRYVELEVMAGSTWKSLKTNLLKGLYQERFGRFQLEAAVNIFIHEKLYDNAIAMVTKRYASDALVQKVMPIVTKTHGDWVNNRAEEEAEKIIEAGKAKHYDRAVGWLEHSRAAYLANNRKAEWQAYLLGIRTKHGKKRKLMGLIQHL